MKSAARVRLDHRGIITVETDMTDIGTGTYTIIAQTAAEMMGLRSDTHMPHWAPRHAAHKHKRRSRWS
jgi:CO/xanthine dehydrogenase Mo-binding subunit